MADKPISHEEMKILNALELLLTRAREDRTHESGWVKGTVGLLRKILTIYNAEINVFNLEKELEEMLDEKNIVELVRKKFDKYKKNEHTLSRFILEEDISLQELNRLIKIQNQLLLRLKAKIEADAAGKKQSQEILNLRGPTELGAAVDVPSKINRFLVLKPANSIHDKQIYENEIIIAGDYHKLGRPLKIGKGQDEHCTNDIQLIDTKVYPTMPNLINATQVNIKFLADNTCMIGRSFAETKLIVNRQPVDRTTKLDIGLNFITINEYEFEAEVLDVTDPMSDEVSYRLLFPIRLRLSITDIPQRKAAIQSSTPSDLPNTVIGQKDGTDYNLADLFWDSPEVYDAIKLSNSPNDLQQRIEYLSERAINDSNMRESIRFCVDAMHSLEAGSNYDEALKLLKEAAMQFLPKEDLIRIAIGAMNLIELKKDYELEDINNLSGFAQGLPEHPNKIKVEPLRKDLMFGNHWHVIILTADDKHGIVVPAPRTVLKNLNVGEWFDLNCPSHYGTNSKDIKKFPVAVKYKGQWMPKEKGRIESAASSAGTGEQEEAIVEDIAANPGYTHIFFGAFPEDGESKMHVKGNEDINTIRDIKEQFPLYLNELFPPQERVTSEYFKARIIGIPNVDGRYLLSMFFFPNLPALKFTNYSMIIPKEEAGKILPIIKSNLKIVIRSFQRIFPQYDWSKGKLQLDDTEKSKLY